MIAAFQPRERLLQNRPRPDRRRVGRGREPEVRLLQALARAHDGQRVPRLLARERRPRADPSSAARVLRRGQAVVGVRVQASEVEPGAFVSASAGKPARGRW